MTYFNSCTFIGTVVKDAKYRRTRNQRGITSWTLAIERRWTKRDGQKTEACERTLIDCRAWPPFAAAIGKFATEGKLMLVQGEMRQDPTQDGKYVLTLSAFRMLPGVSSDDLREEITAQTVVEKPAEKPPKKESKPVQAKAVKEYDGLPF